MSNREMVRPPEEIRRVFELLDNVNTVSDGDNFKYGMQVGKLLALGWVLGEVASSDLALHYEFDDWVRDVKAQEENLKRELGGLEKLFEQSSDED